MERRTLLLGLALFVFAAPALAQKVNTDWDVAANFANYKTYAWPKGEITGNSLVDSRIKVDVDTQLQAKGWTLAEDINRADAAVVANVSTTQRKSLDTFYTGMGGWGYGGWGGGMTTATTNVNTYTDGTMVVDIFDAKTRKLLFRGIATATVSDNPQKNAKTISKATEKMFKKFPPKSKT